MKFDKNMRKIAKKRQIHATLWPHNFFIIGFREESFGERIVHD